jgi:hypothetical protein
MILTKVYFSGLEFDPAGLVDRWHRGIIPLEWSRCRFTIPRTVLSPVNNINRWLFSHIEGRWAIWIRFINQDAREVNLAFEHNFDSVMFVLADGKTKSVQNETEIIF